MWFVPFVAVVLHWVFHRITSAIGAWLAQTVRLDESTAFFGLSVAGARSMLETVVTLNLSFLVFTFGSLLVAIQVAGGQYTPRMRSMLENLMQILPAHRRAELRQQLELLGRTIDGHYEFPEDRALAYIPDPQGLGGAVGVQPMSDAPTAEVGRRNGLL